MSYIEKEKLIKADIASIENRVRHAFNQGYDLGFKDGKKRTKPQEQEPTSFQWCDTCKEYDQDKHCCHRWNKVIRQTVAELKQETNSALKDIRQDISNELERMYMYRDYANGLGKAIEYIDKRIAESEEKL